MKAEKIDPVRLEFRSGEKSESGAWLLERLWV